ncbi:hypothetical protein FJ959_23980 [Mesorhizobium sp. B2-2-4]|nr:hypothetical protein FJW11_11370 [Mesorhizobium sp. B3-1-1]TPJ05703.1 hypothetical protein FJ428_13630 [Mesorhizobium sp. B2-8-1]TPJ47302.1 hypothetical protein FJ437_10405 [Mesorhizobium sp. B2-6-6]TPJ53395.1 hypothetical protein FJ426_13355 [Mesorhizobium sp. B2-6-4]TPJ59901.1 hypothetical protein FJ443_22165 [Mesorhizobium sp. B2-6-1]TPJ69828.1 hypothetical protein FJ462_07990 [Mesorhizobium sp. B2-6-7]TPJ82146.1 hypothetical protein FJ422_19755 [Mesorhizobium sp. B2-6-3]TPJ92735.1 hyp
MGSDFEAARRHLKRARQCLHGDDHVSRETVERIDEMIIALAAEECSSFGSLFPFGHRTTRNSEAASSKA